jgi:predicted RNase H-like HicB family nuclease
MKTIVLNYNVILQKEGKVFVAHVPTLGIADSGESVEEAKRNVQEAIECHVEGLIKTGDSVPPCDTMEVFVSQSQVRITSPFQFAY